MAGPKGAEDLGVIDEGGNQLDEGPINDQGLTAEEQAEFDAMQTGVAPDGDDGDGDGDGEGDAPLVNQPLAAAPKAPAAKEPAAPAETVLDKLAGKKTVSVGKHVRELQERDTKLTAAEQRAADLATQLDQERTDKIKLGERLALINEALTAAAKPAAPAQTPEEADPEPDPNEDLFAHNAWLRRQLAAVQGQVTDIQTGNQAQNEEQQLAQTYTNDARAYMSQPGNEDFGDAYNHLKNSRLREIAFTLTGKDPAQQGVQFSPQETNEIIHNFNQEEKWLVQSAIKSGRSPAAAIHQMAVVRGYVKAAAAPAPAPAPAARAPAAPAVRGMAPAAARPVAAPAAAAGPTVAQQLAELQANRDAGRSLSDGGGAEALPTLSAENLVNMSEEDFNQLLDTLPKFKIDQLLGRNAM